jgi:hypothetical protein
VAQCGLPTVVAEVREVDTLWNCGSDHQSIVLLSFFTISMLWGIAGYFYSFLLFSSLLPFSFRVYIGSVDQEKHKGMLLLSDDHLLE